VRQAIESAVNVSDLSSSCPTSLELAACFCLLLASLRNHSIGTYINEGFGLAFAGAMARVNSAQLSGSMVVLGLVIEQPNQTVTHIAQCLDRRFARSRFAPSTAHNALPQMADAKHKRVCRTYEAPGDDRSEDRYEATDEGVEAFEAWMFEMPNTTPVLREAMYGRIELCQPEHLPRLIKMARREEAIADDQYQHASRRLRKYAARKREPRDVAREIREVLLYVDPKRWFDRSESYKEIAKRLEEIHREIEALGLESYGG
jgi:hypothetical protein